MTCPQCGSSEIFDLIDGVETDLCLVCYRESLPSAKKRVAWRCHHCKTLRPWTLKEHMFKDKPYCDDQCIVARKDLEENVSSLFG